MSSPLPSPFEDGTTWVKCMNRQEPFSLHCSLIDSALLMLWSPLELIGNYHWLLGHHRGHITEDTQWGHINHTWSSHRWCAKVKAMTHRHSHWWCTNVIVTTSQWHANISLNTVGFTVKGCSSSSLPQVVWHFILVALMSVLHPVA